jgi:hypothetical protein
MLIAILCACEFMFFPTLSSVGRIGVYDILRSGRNLRWTNGHFARALRHLSLYPWCATDVVPHRCVNQGRETQEKFNLLITVQTFAGISVRAPGMLVGLAPLSLVGNGRTG